MRFSDLKKIRQQEAERPAPKSPVLRERFPEPAPPARPPEPAAPPAQTPTPVPAPAPQPAPEALRRREPAPKPSDPAEEYRDLLPQAREVYSRLLLQADAFLKATDQPYCEKYESALALCGLVAGTLQANPYLLNLTNLSTADDYLKAHTANTAIIALAMGLEARLDSRELGLLGFCALAHDMGMTGYSTLYNKAERLAEAELAEMALHAEAGAAKLDRIVDLDYKVKERARRIILQIHEKPDGTGYPDRVSGEELDPLAQLIAVADAYEALTHPRPWREPRPQAEAIKELISREGGGFNAGAVKLLISALSIYPPGSLVLLSTGETARVLRVNRGLLSRPVVEILLSPDGEEAAPALADLKDHPLLSIERSLTPPELRDRNARFAARLELEGWWTDW